jgi:hypothetical protein
MRFKKLTERQKYNKLVEKESKWHKKFAWKPTILKIGNSEVIVWLEFYGRKAKVDQFDFRNMQIDGYQVCLYEDLLVNKLKDTDENAVRKYSQN